MKYGLHRKKTQETALIVLVVIVILFITLGCIAYFYYHKNDSANLNDVSVIKQKVGALYLLPVDEEPALATVTDSTKLASSFAGRTLNGDKILIYEKNKKAIVYRPGINKIVDVQPVQIDTVDTQKK